MIRTLFLLLVAASLTARASDPISAAYAGASSPVSQPHVTAELIPETDFVSAGKPFDVILHLFSDPGWHTYWINPGDAGLATTISWTLPPGFTAGPIQWPTPEKHAMGPLMTYGYAGEVCLLVTITPPKTDLPRQFEIKAHADWLVCKEECIPGKGDFSLKFNVSDPYEAIDTDVVENTEFFKAARARLPALNLAWDVSAIYAVTPTFPGTHSSKEGILISFKDRTGTSVSAPPGKLRFFPEQPNVLSALDADNLAPLNYKNVFTLPIALQQNGDKPNSLSGVLVSDEIIGRQSTLKPPHLLQGAPTKAIYIDNFLVISQLSSGPATTNAPVSSEPPQATVSNPPVAVAGPATAPPQGPAAATPAPAVQPFFLGVLGAAFLGGLILNLMPCVLPVLSLKVFSLVRHAGDDPRGAWKQGVAFTAGVVVSFWVLAGLLLALRAFGKDLGWGFQMQSPGFVLALIFLFFLLALNLLGVFEIGTSLAGVDAKATSHLSGSTSSFANGALATVAATPCTGPYLGWALGLAVQESTFASLLIFTFIALGLAAPYLLLTTFPGALRFVPKPGAWMEALRQVMGFLLLATVIWLVYIFGALVGEERVPFLLGSLLLATVAAWIYGRWVSFAKPLRERIVPLILTLVFLAAALKVGLFLALAAPSGSTAATSSGGKGALDWQPWTPAAVDQALAQGQPAFVDFTAAWCGNCKVNEWYALENADVLKAFADKKVTLLRADWTRYDPDITKTLLKYNRSGVPLYLLYSPQEKDSPQVLPDGLITPGNVLDALKKL